MAHNPNCLTSCPFFKMCDEAAQAVGINPDQLMTPMDRLGVIRQSLVGKESDASPATIESITKIAAVGIQTGLETLALAHHGVDSYRTWQATAVDQCRKGPGRLLPRLGEISCRSKAAPGRGFTETGLARFQQSTLIARLGD